MPLIMADVGVEHTITKINGNEKIKKFLEDLGFTTGGTVTVVSNTAGNIIVCIKGARIALDNKMASKILI